MFAFTSIGGKVDTSVNYGGEPPQFIISRQNYHCIGNLLPCGNERPKFVQLYIYDTNNEAANRMFHFSGSHSGNNLDESLVRDFLEMIGNSNAYAKIYRRVKDLYQQSPDVQVSVRLFRHRPIDTGMYNLPSADKVAALIVGGFDSSNCRKDIIVKFRDGKLQRIHETQTSYIPLQYPLLFPYGEDGYQERIPLACPSSSNSDKKRVRVSARAFFAFRLHGRRFEETILLRSRRLLQQFVVDGYSIVESQRLSFVRNNQNMIRTDFLKDLEEAIDRGDLEASSIGKRIVLPSSFTGSRRYMFNNCQDAFAIFKNFGYPDLFLTITCNPKWVEIQRFISNRGLTVHDRPDILCRVFKMKLDAIMADFKKGEFFGRVVANVNSPHNFSKFDSWPIKSEFWQFAIIIDWPAIIP